MKLCLGFLLLLCGSLCAQTATLRGVVTDESGAIVPAARVMLTGTNGLVKTVTAGSDGAYSFSGLPQGDYTVQARAPELVLPEAAKITLKTGTQTLNLQLKVAPTQQQMTVKEHAAPSVSTESANNAGALVMRGADLEALSDSPEDLQEDLLALAGPAAGPN